MELNTPLYKCHLTPKFQKDPTKNKISAKSHHWLHWSAARRNLVGVCGFGETNSKDVQEQDKPDPQVSASSALTQKTQTKISKK